MNIEESKKINRKKSKKIPIMTIFLLMIIVVLSLSIYTVNKELEQEESNSLTLNESLLQFQKIAILNNADYIKKEIKLAFPNIDEFRIIFFDGSSKRFSIAVLIGKPIVDEKSSIGYSYNNLYFIRSVINDNNLKIEKIEKALIKAPKKLNYKEISSSKFIYTISNISIIKIFIKITDYLFPFFKIGENINISTSHMDNINKMLLESQEKLIEDPILYILNSHMDNINKMILESQKGLIENPILLVKNLRG